MSAELLALVAVILLLAAMALYAALRGREHLDDERGLPRELRGAAIAYAERTFKSERHKLVARLDRAYRTTRGLELVELKTRASNVVYMSDVIELSVQRLAVQDQTGEPVVADAWVVVENSGTRVRRPHRVRLLEDKQIAVMSQRYRGIVGKQVGNPSPAKSVRQCQQCAHRGRCSATFGDRL